MIAGRLSLGPLLLLCAACSSSDQASRADNRPEQVVEQFVDRMQRLHGSPKSARAAYDLLWAEARKNLGERAKRASALSGRKVAPEEMIAPSRFSLHFRPKRYVATVQGKWAMVEVIGDEEATQRRSVRTVLEGDSWRVVMQLPPLSPIQQRPPQRPREQ